MENRFRRGFLSAILFTLIYLILNYFFWKINDWYYYLFIFVSWFLLTSSKWWTQMLIEDSKKNKNYCNQAKKNNEA